MTDRHPVAAAIVDDVRVLVANQATGSLSLVDLAGGKVEREWIVGKSLTDIVALDESRFGVLDQAGHEWLVVEPTATGDLHIHQRLPIARWPQSVARVGKSRVLIAGLWSRTLSVLDQGDDQRWSVTRTISLSFNPRCQLVLRGGKVLVADAFGGQLAIVDPEAGEVVSQRSLIAHNIRGLTLSPDRMDVYLSHQVLDEDAATTHSNVSLGIVISNLVRRIPVSTLLNPRGDIEQESSRIFVGRTLEGAADPNGVAFEESGDLLVAVGGTNEVCRLTTDGVEVVRLPVGPRPTALLPVKDAVVAVSTLGQSLTVIGPDSTREIPLGPEWELTRAQKGERDFYNGRLSLESWMSCHSCHPDGHSNGLLADTSSDGDFGTPKRVLSLLGTRDANPWAWNGGMRELNDQVAKSVTSSMQGDPIPLDRQIDMVAFLHSLTAAPPLLPTETEDDRQSIARGRTVFQMQGCAGCHIPPLTYTSDLTYDVGMPDEHGQSKFNPPTLRGVSQRPALFHDSRAGSLEDVLDKIGHQITKPLSARDRTDLLRFLRSL